MAAASMLVYVTHIDDSVRGRQGPCVNFWGVTHDRSLYLTMELYLESIRQNLESKAPPLNLSVLDNKQICCVLINHRWHRATIPELKLSQNGMLEVYCVDSGKTLPVPLIFVRTVDITGYEAENIRDCPPLAKKFILADVVAPFGLGTHTRQWSDLAMMFLKVHVENEIWKAAPVAMYGVHQAVRLFDCNNQLLASAMVQQALGVAAQSYHEAVAMSEAMEKQPSFMKPAFYSNPTMKLFPAGCNMTTLSGTLRPNFAIPAPHKDLQKVSQRAYVINNLPHKGRYEVVVSHIAEGPLKFFVQMKSESMNILEMRKQLDCIAPNQLQGTPLGSPCVVVSPSDKLFYRGLITGMKDFGTPSCTYAVYFVDVGNQVPVDLSSIFEIPDELLVPCLCAYRVSLFGVEKLSKFSGLNEIFDALVKSACNLQAEVSDNEKQEINLYDDSGRSICDILSSIYSNVPVNTNVSSLSSTSTLSLTTNAIPISVVEIPTLSLATEESLFVSDAGESGCFFGQLEEIRPSNSKAGYGLKDLNDMIIELTNAYSAQPNPPVLYADSESRLGHYGVVKWEEDGVYYRVRVTKEIESEVEILFIDFGNTVFIPRSKILSPLKCLTRFCQPPYGIHCKLEEVDMPPLKWKHLIMDRWIAVKIVTCMEGIYSVTFTSDPCNSSIAMKIQNAVSKPNSMENVLVIKKNAKTEVPGLAVAKVSTPIPLKDDRHIRSNENGNFSVTIQNKPCSIEKVSGINGKRLTQPISDEFNYPLDLHKIDDVASKENNEVKSKDSITLEQKLKTSQSSKVKSNDPDFRSSGNSDQVTTCTTILKQSPSDGNEKPSCSILEEKVDKPEAEILIVDSETQESEEVKQHSTPLTTLNQPPTIYPKQPEVLADQQVEVVYVKDPSSFYVQSLESCAVLGELEDNINIVYSDESKPTIRNPKSGSACVVQYKGDNGWYRGKIVQICDPQVASVLFVDYGNTQCGPVEQIKEIDEEFVKIPPLAYHCKLIGVEASRVWTIEENGKFGNRTIGKILSATFTIPDSEGQYPVRLLEETKEAKYVINEDFEASSFVNIPLPIAGYTSHSVSDKPISVIISCFVDPSRFFLSPIGVEYQIQLEELEKFYSSLSPNDLLEDQPSLGLPCVARFTEDGRYYRSQILSICDKMANILFIDYGNQQETPLSQLKRITPRFMEFPQMALCCKLKGVKMVSPIRAELQKHIDACFATNEELSASFHPASSEGSSGVFAVDLNVPKIGDVSRYLIEKNVLERDSIAMDVELAPQDLNFVPHQIISTNSVTLCFKSPTDFWVQLEPKVVEYIMERLDKLALDPGFINKKDFAPSIGKTCLAFYETDKRWYRATVVAVKEDCATICYVDYGNSCDVKTSDLRGLPEEFSQQPALAFKCCQDGAENFSEAASTAFEDIVLDLAIFSVKFVKVVDGVLHVRLFLGESDVGELCSSVLCDSLPEETLKDGGVVSAHTDTLVKEVVEDNVAVSSMGECTETPSNQEVLQDSLEVPMVSAMEENVKINPVEVMIVYALSPYQFWVQNKMDQGKFNKMQAEIDEEYNKNSDKLKVETQLSVGQIYCVLHPIYQDWYRARVTKICNDNNAIVDFVDYGDSYTVPFANIFVLVKLFADIPPFATLCSLKKQPEDLSETAVEKFVAECCDKVCRALFGTEENGVRFVDALYVGDENQDVFDLLNGI